MPSPDPREEEILSRRLEGSEPAARYVAKTLLPALGRKGAPFRLEIPREGVRSLVYFIRFQDPPSGGLVLRCVPRRADAHWLQAAVSLFEKHALPAPRPVHGDLSLS